MDDVPIPRCDGRYIDMLRIRAALLKNRPMRFRS